MVHITLPLAELFAHYSAYIVRILEYPSRGCGAPVKRFGQFTMLCFASSATLTMYHSLIWVAPAVSCFVLAGASGFLLDRLEEREGELVRVSKSNRGIIGSKRV